MVPSPARCAALALSLLTGAALAAGGCAPAHEVPASSTNRGPVRILAYRVVHDAPDHLALEVKYHVEEPEGTALFVGATTTSLARHLSHWAYRPDPAPPGEGWARVLLTLGGDAPAAHRSTGIVLKIYRGGGSALARARIAYPKEWVKSEGELRCHRKWGRGCSD